MTLAPTSTQPVVAEVRDQINDHERVKSIPQGLASLLGCLSFWLVTLAAVIFLPWYLKIPFGILNGLAISMLFVVGHDAGHGSLFPIRWMNRLGGRIGLLPALHPYTAWVHNHNGLHHGFTQLREKDPGFPPASLEEYRAKSRFGRWLYRHCRTRLGMGAMYFTGMWLKWEMFPNKQRAPRNPKAYQLDRLYVILFAAAWIGLLVGAALWLEESPIVMVLCGFVIPQMGWNWFIGFVIFQQHTHPRVPWFSELDKPNPTYFEQQVKATPHVHFPGWMRFVMRNIMEHTAHHADPGVPLYHLEDAQKQLERVYRREMVRVIWSPQMMKRTMKICRLYDYENHRWLDYDGTPTTEPLLPPRSEFVSSAAV